MTTPEFIAHVAGYGIHRTLLLHAGQPADDPAAGALSTAACEALDLYRRAEAELFTHLGIPFVGTGE